MPFHAGIVQRLVVDDQRRVGLGRVAHPDPDQVVARHHRIAAHAELGRDHVLARDLDALARRARTSCRGTCSGCSRPRCGPSTAARRGGSSDRPAPRPGRSRPGRGRPASRGWCGPAWRRRSARGPRRPRTSSSSGRCLRRAHAVLLENRRPLRSVADAMRANAIKGAPCDWKRRAPRDGRRPGRERVRRDPARRSTLVNSIRSS